MPTRSTLDCQRLVLLPALLAALATSGCCEVSSIRTNALPDAVVGQIYSTKLEDNCAGQGSLDSPTWQMSSNPPPGLAFSDKGEISGVPSAAGTYSLEVQLVKTEGKFGSTVADAHTYSLVVRPGP